MNFKTLAIITARGGSKRIPHKNIKPFFGVPIINYSIEAALKANCFDEVMVSTDDKEIAEVALARGAKVPFYRSKETSNDYAITADVVEEVLNEYRKRNYHFEYFACIYPTAPFITAENLNKAMTLLKKSNADSVIPAIAFSYPIQRALKVEEGKLKMIWPENYRVRSQDLTPSYHDCGQFYFMKTKKFLEQKNFFTENTIPMILSEEEVQDIDTEEDWKIAELKYRILKNLK